MVHWKFVVLALALLFSSGLATAQTPGSRYALNFDGNDDYVDLGSDLLFQPASVTIEAWLYRPDWTSTASGDMAPLSNLENGGYGFWFNAGAQDFEGYARVSGNWEIVSYSLFNLNPGWHHFAMSYDNLAGTQKLFVDGMKVDENTTPVSGIDYSNANSLLVGADADASAGSVEGNYFRGQIDEVRIWNSPLGIGEIRDYMCRHNLSNHPSALNLVAHYHHDDGPGSNTSTDQSANSLDGTLVNMDPASDWAPSGAALGDTSEAIYPVAANASVLFSEGVISLSGVQSSGGGFQVYRIKDSPKPANASAGFDSLSTIEHFGVFSVQDSVITASEMCYNYTALSSLSSAPNEAQLRVLYKRDPLDSVWAERPSAVDTSGNAVCAKGVENDIWAIGYKQSGFLPYPDRPGSGKSLQFDGNSHFVDLGTTQLLKPSDELTVSCWAYKNDWSNIPTDGSTLLGNTDTGGYSFFLSDASAEIQAYVRRNGAWGFEGYSVSNLSPGWHHLAMRYDGRFLEFYVDGELVGTDDAGATYPIDYTFPRNSTLIGAEIAQLPRNLSPNIKPFTGRLDEVQIWDTARTANRIRQYTCQKLTPQTPGWDTHLMGYYRFDEEDGDGVLQDLSPKGNDGRLYHIDATADRQVSGAALGDTAVYAVPPTSLFLDDGDTLEVSTPTSGSPSTLFAYKERQEANTLVAPPGYNELDSSRYFGLYMGDSANAGADVTYRFATNPLTGSCQAALAYRSNNAGNWQGANSIVTGNAVTVTDTIPGEWVFAKGPNTFDLPAGFDNFWIGCQSRDWFDPSNWATGAVPTNTDKVLIPLRSNQPLIQNNVASVFAITIEESTGAELEINADSGADLIVAQP